MTIYYKSPHQTMGATTLATYLELCIGLGTGQFELKPGEDMI